METVSAVLVCLNSEKDIDRCLASVAWCDEIVVVDSFSTDRTVELARKYTERVYQHEYPGYSLQVERAIEYATGDWIFIIDADEEVSAKLADQCREILHEPPTGPEAPLGYKVFRRVEAFGKWVDHGGWCPDYKFRFFRREAVVPEHQEIHGDFTTHGPVGHLDGYLYHYTWVSLFAYLRRINDYSSLEVANKLRANPDAQAPWHKIVFSPLQRFWRRYVMKQGFRDGGHGLALACLDAMSASALYLKLWEYRLRESEGGEDMPPIRNEEIIEAKRHC